MKVSNRSERCKAGARSDTCFCMILYRLRLTEHSSRCFMQPHAEATWQAFVSRPPRPVRSLWCRGAACPRTPDRLARAGWSSSSPAPGTRDAPAAPASLLTLPPFAVTVALLSMTKVVVAWSLSVRPTDQCP
uniref:Uncharacterized protein n=1 Tax=Rousettus aegyptiacus TaxID=9407 RepID=A0A7J8HSL9_ROUAE|nr:hypothetical protein HJG63_011123 [Rousettus aegyptiacus]